MLSVLANVCGFFANIVYVDYADEIMYTDKCSVFVKQLSFFTVISMLITDVSLFMYWTDMKMSAKSVLSALELKTYEKV